ncbi:MAG: MBL fold metallo-hydrolase [Fusobacterium varium]|uniref:MBL fold metallo-hydrolase n=1 Tax=Fusobacterium varium TaxID=856 RepID=UPI002430760F|nr:MBL fold metallo-hydrolase [Fusobacterium varium]UYI78961.1 MAG: MBL fold metallo-hydrolase [Fusobacterium varium]
MNRLISLNIDFISGTGNKDFIYPVIIQNDKENILIDCSTSGFLPLLEKEAEKNNFDLSNLTKIIITHHDHDHMGGLYEITEKYPHIQVVSSLIEKPYIEGTKKSLRLEQAEKIYPTLSEAEKINAEYFHNILKSIKHVPVDITIDGDKELDWCGGIKIIATPGHMPGHISIYSREFKTLITGDAMVAQKGELFIANPQYTLDMKEAIKSIEKFLDYDIQQIVCYHGGLVKGDITSILKKLLK